MHLVVGSVKFTRMDFPFGGSLNYNLHPAFTKADHVNGKTST